MSVTHIPPGAAFQLRQKGRDGVTDWAISRAILELDQVAFFASTVIIVAHRYAEGCGLVSARHWIHSQTVAGLMRRLAGPYGERRFIAQYVPGAAATSYQLTAAGHGALLHAYLAHPLTLDTATQPVLACSHRAAPPTRALPDQGERSPMCDTAVTPQVKGIDKDEPNAKVFIEGKNRPLFVTQPVAEIRPQLVDLHGPALQLTNINGEDTLVPRERVVSVVAATPRDRKPVKGVENALVGKGFHVNGTHMSEIGDLRLQIDVTGVFVTGDEDVYRIDECVTVHGEDLAREIAVIVHQPTGQVVYRNQAEPDRCVRRYVKAARLLGEASAILDEVLAS
jgi:hypothetical protein